MSRVQKKKDRTMIGLKNIILFSLTSCRKMPAGSRQELTDFVHLFGIGIAIGIDPIRAPALRYR